MKVVFFFVFFLFFLSANAQTKTQQVDSLVGGGWHRVLFTTTTTVDTIEQSPKKLVLLQTEIKEAEPILVDPKIKNYLYSTLLLGKKDQVTVDSSVDYLVSNFWFYSKNQKIEKRIFWNGDSIKLSVVRAINIRSSNNFVFYFLAVSFLFLSTFTVRNFLGEMHPVHVFIIGLTILIAIIAGFLIAIVRRDPEQLAFGMLIIILFLIFFIICISEEVRGQIILIFLGVVSFLFSAPFFMFNEGVFMVCFLWFISLYFLGYLLAKIIAKVFYKKLKIKIKVFV